MRGLESLKASVTKGDIEGAVARTREAVEEGVDPQTILDEGLIAAMDEVGELFSKGRLFVPQMLRAARTMVRRFLIRASVPLMMSFGL